VKKIDIYLPRLDVPFKKSYVTKERSSIPEIRMHWLNFVRALAAHLSTQKYDVKIIEMPLWMITIEYVGKKSVETDFIFIPHKMKQNWNLDNRVFYYMQMAVPHIFSIDNEGWCASASHWPISIDKQSINGNVIKIFNERISSNKSKFTQSLTKIKLPPKYVFFPCQLPHDETIKFHSDISVEQALEALILWLINFPSDIKLVIKSHPANLKAMDSLKQILKQYLPNYPFLKSMIIWLDGGNIHELISNSIAIFTVNSGVGLEAMAHCKMVYTFGNADYYAASKKIMFGGSLNNAAEAINYEINQLKVANNDYIAVNDKKMLTAWYNTHFDTKDLSTFKKFKIV